MESKSAMALPSQWQLMVIVCTILVFAIPINLFLFFLKKYRSRTSKSYINIHGYQISTDVEPASDESEGRPHTFVDRGYLSSLPARSFSAEKQAFNEHEARGRAQAVLAHINERYPRNTYRGSKQTSPKAGAELDCLYARYRVNGTTKVMNKIAFIDGRCVKARVHRQDADIIYDAGWATNGHHYETRGMMSCIFPRMAYEEVPLHFPRTTQECQTLEAVLDAATRFNIGAEDDA